LQPSHSQRLEVNKQVRRPKSLWRYYYKAVQKIKSR